MTRFVENGCITAADPRVRFQALYTALWLIDISHRLCYHMCVAHLGGASLVDNDFPMGFFRKPPAVDRPKMFASFVEDAIPVSGEYIKYDGHVACADNKHIIKRIACGANLWDRDDSDGDDLSDNHRHAVLRRVGHIVSNNQGTERGNKDQNNAHKNQREEASISARVSSTSWIREQCKAQVLGQKKVPWRGKRRIVEMVDRINLSTGRLLG
jgi:hypothetical protein